MTKTLLFMIQKTNSDKEEQLVREGIYTNVQERFKRESIFKKITRRKFLQRFFGKSP